MSSSDPAPLHPRRRRGRILRAGLAAISVIVLVILVFLLNGMWLAYGETPYVVVTRVPPADPIEADTSARVKVLAFNIAKCFVFEDHRGVNRRQAVENRLVEIAAIIRREQPDVVFLSEAMTEYGPVRINQVDRIAELAAMHTWAFGENYNVGVPFFRAVGGNAVLSRRPIRTVANPSLAGRRPFWVTKNNRRVLWCSTTVAGREILLGAIHNDSFNPRNNLRQVQQELAFIAGREALIAGDFNAHPGEAPIELLRDSGLFTGSFDGPFTFPAAKPIEQIDLILAPARWALIETHVVESTVSDHRAIVSTFGVP